MTRTELEEFVALESLLDDVISKTSAGKKDIVCPMCQFTHAAGWRFCAYYLLSRLVEWQDLADKHQAAHQRCRDEMLKVIQSENAWKKKCEELEEQIARPERRTD